MKPLRTPRPDWEAEAEHWKRLYLALARDYVEASDAAFALRDMLNERHAHELERARLQALL